MQLDTNAERAADRGRDLPIFKEFSLPGVREKVAQVLSLIGRGGLFSTYAVHDIRHIDAMLKMCGWLVPPSTQRIMTPAEWLMLVLAIYLHDLGMVVPEEEYHRRHDSPAFEGWFSGLAKSSEGREYIARTRRMTPNEKELFFFQEFVRQGHPARIREWITGHQSAKWGKEVKPLADAIAEFVKPLPSRFRDHLGAVCESHHMDNLDDHGKYPLLARLGNDPMETANVQYVAIILRTVDLLHVTKDRTPSVQYELVRFSDPKSVEEWDKQRGTFAVGSIGRNLVEGDPDSAVVKVDADFTDERPLFALQEYIAYADTQIKQSNRWAEKSQEEPDAKDYSFPWHEVRGDVRFEGVPPLPMRFELDRGRLLDLLVGHTIYNDPTVAVRELLQNGIDAVRYQQYLDVREAKANGKPISSIGKVTVRWDPKERVLIVEDTGTGMDRDIIKYHLMNVGSSFYNSPQFESEQPDFAPISRFGIGILTCFMVSDDVEIITFKREKGYRIRMTSVQSNYLLRELPAGDPLLDGLLPHGTRVTVHLRETIDVSKRTVEDILRYWVILPECPVEYLESGKEPVGVGFASLEEALRYYHSPEFQSQDDSGWKSEVLLKHRNDAALPNGRCPAASYQLAFAVRSGYLPERSFILLYPGRTRERRVDCPQVCIEGIRVDNMLPGFLPNRLACMLAISGSRKLRTTVSRYGMEEDEEYERVAKLCAEMLFEHIQEEVRRISGKPGSPLSQASTACDWLYSNLLGSVRSAEVREHLEPLYESLPSIVEEVVRFGGEKPDTTRCMLSPRELRGSPEFWTVESRLVDSLGTISRDLGRELSLSQFLALLAPGVKQLEYTPLLPDADLFARVFHRSHRPERVEFSRAHQQTAIKWVPQTDSEGRAGFDLREACSREFLSELLSASAHRVSQPHDLVYVEDVFVAPIVGDSEKVEVVTTRVGTVMREGTEILSAWSVIRSGILTLSSAMADARRLVDLLLFVSTFRAAVSGSDERRYQVEGNWQAQVPVVRQILSELGKSARLPDDPGTLISSVSVFNAARYWLNWGKRAAE